MRTNANGTHCVIAHARPVRVIRKVAPGTEEVKLLVVRNYCYKIETPQLTMCLTCNQYKPPVLPPINWIN